MAWIIPIFAGLVVLDKILNGSEEKEEQKQAVIIKEREKQAVIKKEVIGDIDESRQAESSRTDVEEGADVENSNTDSDSASSSAAEQENSNITEESAISDNGSKNGSGK